MIGYVTLGTNDFQRATAFYDALFAELGAKRIMEMERLMAWGVKPHHPAIGVIKPFNGEPATSGNGSMVAVHVDSRDKVDALHKKALELGARDEGAPGLRGGSFYAGYFRDLDGNKLNFFHIG